MVLSRSRRDFLATVGRGTLVAALGPAMALDLGLVPKAFADDVESPLQFGDLEPLVVALQETPVERLQPMLLEKIRGGMPLKTLVAAAALGNARSFGGEDYIGFHTFMALAPALTMSGLMPQGAEALPIFKVLYRNTNRIQETGARKHENLHVVSASTSAAETRPTGEALFAAIRAKEKGRAEQILSSFVAADPRSGLDALIPAVQDAPEVHRTVLPYRAWEMQKIVGTEHALTLLRQSLRYCVKGPTPAAGTEMSEHGKVVASVFDEFKLSGREPGKKTADDAFVEHLSQTFATASPQDAARAAGSALAEGFEPAAIGEAISLAASLLVLRDGGRLPQWEDRLKVAGSVHGDSVGVHASDAANAWRNLATVSSGRNQFACLISGAWQVARDRTNSPNLMTDALPGKYQLGRVTAKDADTLLSQLDEAVRDNLQGQATAIVHQYGQLALPAEKLFARLVRFAVSEDGALHAEKYFQTVWDDFHATRPSARWRHLTSLARVTASEYGKPAAGQAEARGLLGIKS